MNETTAFTLELSKKDIGTLLAGDPAAISKRILNSIGIPMEVVLSSHGATLRIRPSVDEKGVLVGNSHHDPDAVIEAFSKAISAIEVWKVTILSA